MDIPLELKVLEELNHKIDLKLYGIENNENFLDLNEVNEFQNIFEEIEKHIEEFQWEKDPATNPDNDNQV